MQHLVFYNWRFFEEKGHGLKLKARVHLINDLGDFPLHLQHIAAKILNVRLQTMPLCGELMMVLCLKSDENPCKRLIVKFYEHTFFARAVSEWH